MSDYLNLFLEKCRDCDYLFYKVLSQNDRSWAWPKDQPGYAHQGGPLIPDNCTDIFPRREVEQWFGKNLVGNRYYRIRTFWIEDDGEWREKYEGNDWRRQSKFGRSYKDRGEFRITGGLPPEYFRYMRPGSLLAIARDRGHEQGGEYRYYCLTVETETATYDEFIRTLVIPDPPWSGIVEVQTFMSRPETALRTAASSGLAELQKQAALFNTIRPIASAGELAKEAMKRYEARLKMPLAKFFSVTPRPGDIVRELMEEGFEILKRQQQNIYPMKIANLIWSASQGKNQLTQEGLAIAIAGQIEGIRSVFKSMQNSIFSLAGSCFEKYIEVWLDAFDLPFEIQKRVDGDRIPDFVLPSRHYYMARDSRSPDDAILLSAKTTCRERWTQILSEGKLVDTKYLATLDAAVPKDKINSMLSERVVLVVPESEKSALEHYRSADNVLEFQQFMSTVLLPKKKLWSQSLKR
jgi:hypothetical protein